MNLPPRRPVSRAMPHARLALALALALLAGCAAAPAAGRETTVVTRGPRHPPDVHGDPLRLLPADALTWVRADLAALRASAHFEAGMSLARDLGADFARVERELGFDPFRRADALAFAVYAPPGNGPGGWPIVYARGAFDRDAVLASARARAPQSPPTTLTEESLAFTVIGERAYLFPAPDVMLVMERALVRRVAARLAGASERAALDDPRFAELWRAAGGTEGPVTAAADLAAMRSRNPTPNDPPQARGLDLAVLRGDARGDVTVRAAALARDAATARAAVTEFDAIREDAAGQLAVRLLGLSGLLREGIQTRADGPLAVVTVDARQDDVRRLLRATALLRELTAR
jgi:hypothetical protein